MKYIDEYRDGEKAQALAGAIRRAATRPWTVMEICGGQTHAIMRYGIDELLPDSLTLVHGPGCPVCVTPVELIDKAIAIASAPGAILCSFGDILRVPGTRTDLLSVKAAAGGGDVRVVYSPMDALEIARRNPGREVVFFAIGFETTAPANAMAVYRAKREGVMNFSCLVSHALVPPALEAILSSQSNGIDGFLAAGHVCTVMGWREYQPLAQRYRVPIVVTGFEPLDILQGIHACVAQLEAGRHEVENRYARSVRRDGNTRAREFINEVFEVVDRRWRGIGEIPRSGLGLREGYAAYDAENRFDLAGVVVGEPVGCVAGEILQGVKKPYECAAFGVPGGCTPEHPQGAPMVSSEGACAAYYRYRGACRKGA